VMAWVRARPLLSFYLLTFAITWGTWWPMAAYHQGWTDLTLPVLYLVGGLGPGIAAYVVMSILRGRAAGSELLGPLLRWRGPAGAGGRWPSPCTR
jgi:formate-dependent nitrite reductase membrane component NrfD